MHKKFVVSMASTPSSRESEQLRTYWYHSGTRTKYGTKVTLSTGVNMTGWTVVGST